MLIHKILFLLFFLPLAAVLGLLLSAVAPNTWFTGTAAALVDFLLTTFPALILASAVIASRQVYHPTTRKGWSIGLLFFLLIMVPGNFFLGAVIGPVLGTRFESKSIFIPKRDYGIGKNFSALQKLDAAAYVSGTDFKWGPTGQAKVDACHSSEQYIEKDCKLFDLPATGKCFECSYMGNTQDHYYSLVFQSEKRLTEFYSVNHDFAKEPPTQLRKYFVLSSEITK